MLCVLVHSGSLSGGRRQQQPRLAATAHPQDCAAVVGETLRTRFNKYALTKAGRLGPMREPHKDALFQQLQAAGGQLYFR